MTQLKVENSSGTIAVYVIPMDGELFVPGESVAKFLGAKAILYNTSQILEIAFNNSELIFRAGTNVVYDNRIKTPLPASSLYMNNDVYIPISVISKRTRVYSRVARKKIIHSCSNR